MAEGARDIRPKLFGSALMSAAENLVLDWSGAAAFFVTELVTLESFLVSVLAAAATVLYSDAPGGFGANVSWTLVSVAVVFPLSHSVGEAFKRRDAALAALAGFGANAYVAWLAHRDWDWPANGSASGGRARNLRQDHASDASATLLALVRAARSALLCPNVGRVRHFRTGKGAAERRQALERMAECEAEVTAAFARQSLLVEELKAAGMPGNEASRARQYAASMLVEWERLRALKRYRTSQGMRVFARVAIVVLPVFYGPYYAWLAADGGANLAFAVAYSVLTSQAMTALFNVRYVLLEDPLTSPIDGVHVDAEFDTLEARLLAEPPPRSPPPPPPSE